MRGQICCLLSGNNEGFGCQETSHVPEARRYDINMRTITYKISAGLFVKRSTYSATHEDVFKLPNYYHNLPMKFIFTFLFVVEETYLLTHIASRHVTLFFPKRLLIYMIFVFVSVTFHFKWSRYRETCGFNWIWRHNFLSVHLGGALISTRIATAYTFSDIQRQSIRFFFKVHSTVSETCPSW